MARFNTTFSVTSETIDTKLENYVEIEKLVDEYTGEYEITPQAYQSQTLDTKEKKLTDDITVFQVPFYKVDNPYGQTVSIAQGV